MQRNDVTIAIPIYNEEKHIEAAIRSAAPQCEILLIADNASHDRSPEICRRISKEYQNIVFVRHSTNMGAADNFKFLLDRATTSRFMWLGGHDLLPATYVSQLDQALSNNSEVALAYGAVEHIDEFGMKRGKYEYGYNNILADNSPLIRLLGLICYLSDCSLVHGLFRTEILRSAWVTGKYIGLDHILLSKTALLGKFIYVPETHLLRRDAHPHDTKQAQLARISGRSSSERATYQEMQRQQYTLVIGITQSKKLKDCWIRFKARVFLVNRFGPFSANIPIRCFEYFLRGILYIRKQFRRRFT